jgi:hypothetical protein
MIQTECTRLSLWILGMKDAETPYWWLGDE